MSATQENRAEPKPRPLSPRWTEEEISKLIDLWTTDLTNAEIAKKLGREESAVAVKASRINLPRRATLKGAPSKARVRPCLRCQKPFYSTGPGNRVCDPCKESSEWKNGADFYGMIGGY